jgi:hypothetical protein
MILAVLPEETRVFELFKSELKQAAKTNRDVSSAMRENASVKHAIKK